MMRCRRTAFAVLTVWLVFAAAAAAQPRTALDVTAGYAAFLDDSAIEYAVAGGAVRVYVTPRLSVGPEAVYMHRERDSTVFLTGTVTCDLRQAGTAPASSRVVPFIVAGGGLQIHRTRFPAGTFTSREAALTGGGGVRVRISRRWHAAGEARTGWEPHLRLSGTIGFTPGA